MKRITQYLLLFMLGVMLMSAAAHKFYVAVFQMDYVPQKKVVQMTARLFMDDLEAAMTKRFGKKFYIGQKHEVAGSNDFLNKYIAEKVQVKVNGSAKALKFLGKELEDDVLICYYTFPAEENIKTLEVKNTVLLELYNDQQNIIHTNINRNKKSLLLTNDKQEGTLDY